MNKTLSYKLTNIYIFFTGFSVFPLLFFTKSSIQISKIPEMLFWIVLIVAFELKPVIIPRWDQINEITVSFVVHLSAITLLGTQTAIWIVIIGTLIEEIISKKAWYKILFNTGQYGITVLISGHAFYWLKLSPGNIPLDIMVDMPAILIGGAIYILLNTFFVSAVISLTSGKGPLDMYHEDLKVVTGYFYALIPISVAISYLYNAQFPFTILVMIPPLIIADYGLLRYYNLHKETRETLKVLADIIDERDEYTFAHSERVAKYAKDIAEQLGLPQGEINKIETAGRIHDLGKISIEDKVLKKSGKLSADEYLQIKKHPEIAYRLLKNLKPYKEGAEYVLYHHERIDGNGYPRKISGKDIPLGARILTVADSYDAMTSDRTYRKALTQQEAVEELRRYVGTQFDPDVVEAFIMVLKNDYEEA